MSFKSIGAFVCLFCLAVLTIACSSSNSSAEVNKPLVVGMSVDYPPYEFINEKKELVGFDVDMAKALAAKLGKTVEFKELGFDALLIALQKGKIDLIISGMSITPSRQKEIAMIPYHGDAQTSIVLLFWKQIPEGFSSLNDLKSLSNPVVCVQTATIQAEFLSKQPAVKIKGMENNLEILMDLKYGKSLVAYIDGTVSKTLQAQYPELQTLSIPLEEGNQSLGNGIGINKQNTLLIQQVEQAISELKADESLQKLDQKWFVGKEG